MLTGTCLCGAVAWEIDGPCEWMAHCHCSMCRKAHGTAYATFVTFPRDGFRWVRGEDRIARYESSPGAFRQFCSGCGSKLPATEPFAYAPAAPLEGDVGMRPLCHLFVASKAPWHEITDDAKRFDEYPPGAGQPVPRERSTEPAEGKLRGSCLCGAVAYEIDGPLASGQIVSCHCSRCRRARAAPHGSNMFIEDDSFRWLRGSDRLAYYKLPEAQRFGQSFCTTCGSPMPPLSTPTGRRVIPAGSLDDDPGLRGTVHIMVASKAAWEQLTGPDPRHDEYPPADWNPTARPHRTGESYRCPAAQKPTPMAAMAPTAKRATATHPKTRAICRPFLRRGWWEGGTSHVAHGYSTVRATVPGETSTGSVAGEASGGVSTASIAAASRGGAGSSSAANGWAAAGSAATSNASTAIDAAGRTDLDMVTSTS